MKIKKIFIILILFIVFSTIISFTAGKYVYNSVWDYYLSSKGFYFESDLLDKNTKKNSLLKWDGNNISFVLKNNLNNELISEYDIEYSVTCEVLNEEAKYVDCELDGTGQSTLSAVLSSKSKCVNNIDSRDVSKLSKTECEINGYEWKKEIFNNSVYFNLKSTDETKDIDEVSVKITAESKTPYNKKIIGIFNLNKIETVEASFTTSYESFIDYDLLSIINTSNEKKCILVSFNELDYTIENVSNESVTYINSNNGKINSILLEIGKETSNNFKFYKINIGKEYSKEDLIIEEKDC